MSVNDLPIKISGCIDLLAGRKDQNPPPLAEKLHNWGYIYKLYSLLDGLSLSYSMIKYLFDLITEEGHSASDKMHDELMGGLGGSLAGGGAVFLTVFSMLANHYEDDNENRFKRFIAVVWPYVRDTLKGLKNGYKGVRNSLQVFESLGGKNLNFLLVPTGLLLGGLSVINRIYYRMMLTKRKEMMKENANLLENIQNTQKLDLLPNIADSPTNFDNPIKRQTKTVRLLALLSAAYGGIADGLYLYIGVFSLCSLAPPVLIAMTVFSVIYLLASIATRVYEEYDFQRKLDIAEAKIELAHSGKTIELIIKQLYSLHTKIAEPTNNTTEKEIWKREQADLVDQFELTIQLFEVNRKKYRSLTTLSYTSAALAGAKRGLYAYSSLASVVFAVGIILTLASAPFPPALLITCISIGMVFLIGFIAHSMLNTYYHNRKQQEKTKAETVAFSDISETLEKEKENEESNLKLADIQWLYTTSKNEVKSLEPERVRVAILDGMAIDPTPQFFFEEWFEVVRSFFSGFGKGAKAVAFTMNACEVAGEDGHYHESAVMLGFIAVSSLLHTVVLALRAYARMGREPLEKPFLAYKQKEENSVTNEGDNCFCEDFLIVPTEGSQKGQAKEQTEQNERLTMPGKVEVETSRIELTKLEERPPSVFCFLGSFFSVKEKRFNQHTQARNNEFELKEIHSKVGGLT